VVWSRFGEGENDTLAPDFLECVERALAARWPNVKFVQEYRRPEGPSIQIVITSTSDTYSSGTTKMHMTSSAALRLEPSELPRSMAKRFVKPIVATGTSSNPDVIRSDVGATPALESARAGTSALEQIRAEVCAAAATQLASL
jgi:hypothetical protein